MNAILLGNRYIKPDAVARKNSVKFKMRFFLFLITVLTYLSANSLFSEQIGGGGSMQIVTLLWY